MGHIMSIPASHISEMVIYGQLLECCSLSASRCSSEEVEGLFENELYNYIVWRCDCFYLICKTWLSCCFAGYMGRPWYWPMTHCIRPQSSHQGSLSSSAVPLLDKPFTRTDFTRRAFHCSVPTVWNSLSETIISADSLSVFKSRLKTYFFHKAFD